VLIINGTGSLGNNAKAFKEDVLAMSGVKSGTLSFYLPVTSSSRNDNTYSKEAVMDSKNGIGMQTWTVDYDYIQTMGMEIIGRNFQKSLQIQMRRSSMKPPQIFGVMIRSGRYIRLQITMDQKFLQPTHATRH
jgi:hypothetical protein